MRISLYTNEQEERLFIRGEARTWARSGLVTDAQLGLIESRTDPGLRQTNVFFRILFFLFASSCLQAVMGLLLSIVGFKGLARSRPRWLPPGRRQRRNP